MNDRQRYRHPMPWRSLIRIDASAVVMGVGTSFVGWHYGLVAGGLWMLGMVVGIVFGHREGASGG